MYLMEGQMSIFDQDSFCGKTSPELCQAESRKEKISESSSRSARESKTQMPLYLDLRKENGRIADASWEMGGALLGEYSMHSFGESPKDEEESHLLQILEENPHPKYSLSARACKGILTRAERRGKVLPPILRMALEYKIAMEVSKSTMQEETEMEKCVAPSQETTKTE